MTYRLQRETEQLSEDWISGRKAIREGIPWIVPGAFAFLQQSVSSNWRVFEWGSGGSTLWFAANCAEIVSVESDPEWKRKVETLLAERALEERATIIHLTRETPEYHLQISIFPDSYFDLVYVDGVREERNACIDAALRKIRPGGWLMVDNTNWAAEYPALLNISRWDCFEFEALPFEWLGQSSEWKTAFYRKPEFILDHVEWLRFLLPALFNTPGTVLYVGASVNRQEGLEELIQAGHRVMILEVWEDNVRYLKERGYEVVQGDVRRLSFQERSFDYTVWWHGPEHVQKTELGETIRSLERLSRKLVVMSCPWGHNPQGAYGGNPFEQHLSTLTPSFFKKFGYDVALLGKENRPPHSSIIVWKELC